MTQGKPLHIILKFAIPIVLGNILQNIYTLADTAIVGKIIGSDALAAVGATGAIMMLIFGISSGLMGGFAVVAAKKVGERDFDALKKTYVNGLFLTLAISLVLTAAGIIFAKDILRLIDTPVDIIDESAGYLEIIFAGISTTLLYNFTAEMMRAVGNSKKPFVYLVIASILNIILDIWFIAGFGWGIKGAAAATVLAQAISALLGFVYITRSVDYYQFTIRRIKPDKKILMECLHIGVPSALLNGVIFLGTIIMQYVTNGFGTEHVAAYSGANTMTNFLLCPIYAVSSAFSVFVSQNYGACRLDRIKKSIENVNCFLCGVYVPVAIIMFFTSKPLLELVYGYSAQTAEYAALLLNVKLLACFALIPLIVFKYALQAVGKPFFPTVSGFVEIAARFIVATQLTKIFGFFGVAITDPATWVVTCIFFIMVYRFEFAKIESEMKQN